MIALSATTNVRAQSDPQKDAGRAFDEGVDLYERASYADAARAFLRADGLAPSKDAISNALSAARRANDHLLVVTVAERALGRETTDPKLAVQARQALNAAAEHLAKLELSCEPKPCDLSIDGAPVEAGVRFLLPGDHAVNARAGEASADQSLNLVANTTYTILLHASKPGEKEHPAEVKTKRATPEKTEPQTDRNSRPLSPAVFYVGVGVTLVLAGVTTWSGLDALNTKHALPSQPTKKQVTDVRNKATRTDIFLAASVLVGGLTTYAGLALVDFGGAKQRATLVVSPSAVSVIGLF